MWICYWAIYRIHCRETAQYIPLANEKIDKHYIRSFLQNALQHGKSTKNTVQKVHYLYPHFKLYIRVGVVCISEKIIIYRIAWNAG